MGKGKKERSKKNKNKKETRKPIKREFEGLKYKKMTHPAVTISVASQRHGTAAMQNKNTDRHMYEKMFLK